MASILPFPTHEVREEIADAIKLHAAGKWRRQRMMSFVAGRLAEYGLRKIKIGSYTVRIAEPINTVTGIWPVVIIEASEVSSKCPERRGIYPTGNSS